MTLYQTHARGKLLLTGEYFVLDGALALALPVRLGQALEARFRQESSGLWWTSQEVNQTTWFQASFRLPDLEIGTTSDEKTAKTLQSILLSCRRQNPAFLADQQGLQVRTRLDFPREWGLGTSSTLIAALSRWAGADPYRVLAETLGGSGYDIACAYARSPLFFQLEDGKPHIQPVEFQPDFLDQLYFVYLGRKQDSRAGISRYRTLGKPDPGLIGEISSLTRQCVAAGTLAEFQEALDAHERLVSRALDLPRVQEVHFPEYWGLVKSLGAWGGDFALATSTRPAAETKAFFNEKGFRVFMPFKELT